MVKDAARTWNVTERQLIKYLAHERIPGAVKIGNTWMIPKDAQKPEDRRKYNRHRPKKVETALYSILVLSYLGFLLYFLTLRPGGAAENPAVVWAITGFASGGMIMMAVYAFTLYLFRRVEKASLYFALLCVGTGARFLVMEGSMTLMGLVPGITYGAALCIRYPSIGLTLIGLMNFIFEIFAVPKHRRRLLYLNATVAILYALAVVAVHNGINTLTVNLLLLLLMVFIDTYCVFVVVTSSNLRENKLHLLYLVSLLLYAVSAVFSALLTDSFPHLPVISGTVFVVAHIVLLSDHYARVITTVERTNEALEEKVARRTAELLSTNERLAEHNAALDSLNQTKTEFLQDMSHEMKTPLTVIATGIDFADWEIGRDGGDLTEARSALDTVREETQRLGRMVSGMISLAAMSGIAENRKRVDFAALLGSSAEAFRLPMEKYHNALRVKIEPDLPDVFVEHDRFTQVMANLLTNAAEYTRDGLVFITAEHDGPVITVHVSDTGDGIERSLLPTVFERGVSGRGGTGYGLYICKTVVEAHGGTIKIESEPGKGTTVIFTVPVYGGQEAGHRL